jgi:hypothetical protein
VHYVPLHFQEPSETYLHLKIIIIFQHNLKQEMHIPYWKLEGIKKPSKCEVT